MRAVFPVARHHRTKIVIAIKDHSDDCRNFNCCCQHPTVTSNLDTSGCHNETIGHSVPGCRRRLVGRFYFANNGPVMNVNDAKQ